MRKNRQDLLALTANETILDKIKEETAMLADEKKKAENNVKGIKRLLSYLVRTLPFAEKSPKLTGKIINLQW